jgi:5-formyltetrahydrofolate cyclo-ligase
MFKLGCAMKAKLRSQKLLERLNHRISEKSAKDKKIIGKLAGLPEIKKARRILFYLPIHGEVDLEPLFGKLKNKKFILPRVKDEKTLHLYYIENLDEVEKGSFSIREPKLHLKRAKPADVEIVLVPGVVFAKNGHRIGYGKGFYDRLLKKTKAVKIGIAYEFQIVENIAGEPHDTPMDMIVTENKIIRINNQKNNP